MEKQKLRVLSGVLAASLAAAATGVNAEEGSSEWQYGFKIYGWLPDLSGELLFELPDTGDSAEVDAEKILDALKMTFMGSFEARKGKWAVATDLIYLDLGDDTTKSVSLPSGDSVELFDAEMGLKGLVWTLAGAYTVWQDQGSHLDLIAGARNLDMDIDLKLEGHGPLETRRKLSDEVRLWDGIVGVKGRFRLGEDWFIPYYGDVGTGDSELTWWVSGGIGYSFDWGDVLLEYRHMEYDQEDDKLLQNIAFSGGLIGVAFSF